ncbi:MAG: hypothetical protein RLZZ500_12 [Bacteroidota bacterium]|jgi:prephenate dehydratase
MKEQIAIQGIQGSFHHQVALAYFKTPFDLVECLSFEDVADCLQSGQATQAVMALENSIAGAILPNYSLIDRNGFHIVGEQYLEIQQNLMALPGQSLATLKEVHSHPMALLQCMAFLKQYPHLKLVEDKDTAETARRIQAQQLQGIAAIGSSIAADLFRLEIIVPEIQNVNNNLTRFAIVSRQPNAPSTQINKASIKFELHHQRGSLAALLNVMSDCRLNLTKIQSLPKVESPFTYAFFVDVLFESYTDFEKATAVLSLMAQSFKIIGIYQNTLP